MVQGAGCGEESYPAFAVKKNRAEEHVIIFDKVGKNHGDDNRCCGRQDKGTGE